jgi:hypothetical protein
MLSLGVKGEDALAFTAVEVLVVKPGIEIGGHVAVHDIALAVDAACRASFEDLALQAGEKQEGVADLTGTVAGTHVFGHLDETFLGIFGEVPFKQHVEPLVGALSQVQIRPVVFFRMADVQFTGMGMALRVTVEELGHE